MEILHPILLVNAVVIATLAIYIALLRWFHMFYRERFRRRILRVVELENLDEMRKRLLSSNLFKQGSGRQDLEPFRKQIDQTKRLLEKLLYVENPDNKKRIEEVERLFRRSFFPALLLSAKESANELDRLSRPEFPYCVLLKRELQKIDKLQLILAALKLHREEVVDEIKKIASAAVENSRLPQQILKMLAKNSDPTISAAARAELDAFRKVRA